MILDTPFWIKQRQAKIEELSTGKYKITGPNLPEAVVSVRMCDNVRWQGVLQSKADGPELAATQPEFETPKDALGAAFELYRVNVIV